PGLAFLVYPEVVLQLPPPPLWSVVFFLMLLILGINSQGGMYIFQLMDYYSASGMTLLFTAFFQTIAITWVYGVKRFSSNIEEMTGHRPNWYFLTSWVFVSPAVCLGIFLFSVVRYKPLVYAETYVYPWWGELLGWGIALASMVWIPSYAVYFLLVTPGSLKDRLIAGITPKVQPSQKLTKILGQDFKLPESKHTKLPDSGDSTSTTQEILYI
ncbi:sodium- and chloride-dependent GABA transporter 2-like, partial [Limulus polyphemus]|uniref:Sodium- and chloride-dependent GABA transporter 2-like n=1 Tax=Limulus polyphemus TaxID=6850 RepID=A0ABM1RUK8_LIMPO